MQFASFIAYENILYLALVYYTKIEQTLQKVGPQIGARH
jgi:hypothetical protein